MTFRKLNVEPIDIVYDLDGRAYFEWDKRNYHLDNFIRTHHNPWIGGNFPEYIHGYEADNYYNPLFIELISDEAVNVYMEVLL